MGNERLRSRMALKGVTVDDLATKIEVDPKTVSRWIQKGRVPQPRHRRQTCMLLDTEESYLWPELLDDERTQRASQAEIVGVYPHRGAVPHDLWRELIEKAEAHVDVLVFAGLFLVDANPDLPGRLVDRAASGLQARLAYGDPDSPVVARRGEGKELGPTSPHAFD